MRRHLIEIKLKLESELNLIDIEETDIINRSKRSISLIQDYLKKLKKQISIYKFPSPDDEIMFFKEIKPSIYSKMIYHFKVFNIEVQRPLGSTKTQIKYFHDEFNKIESFYFENVDFYSYIRNNMSDFDDKYFIRGKLNRCLYVDFCMCDEFCDFSTSHDYKLAQVLAFEQLSNYLNNEIISLERNDTPASKTLSFKDKLRWTESKTSLVELLYAIKYANCINFGAIKVKELKAVFEYLFNIDLSESYRTYSNIKNRQQPAKFIDILKIALTKKVEDDDE